MRRDFSSLIFYKFYKISEAAPYFSSYAWLWNSLWMSLKQNWYLDLHDSKSIQNLKFFYRGLNYI